MAVVYKDITGLDCGAQFFNADLHVHSFGGSKDVLDPTMTPQGIIESAVAQGLSVLAIADHNTDRNVAAALTHAQKHALKLLVLPAVEVTTAHGHLLVYFPPERAGELSRFLAKLDLVGEQGAQNTHTAKSMADTIAEAERLGGICIAAHIDREKTGFELQAPGYPNGTRSYSPLQCWPSPTCRSSSISPRTTSTMRSSSRASSLRCAPSRSVDKSTASRSTS